MNTYFRRAIEFVIVLSVTAGLAATASAADGALRLPVTGTLKGGGDFAGTVTINRFAVCSHAADCNRPGIDIVAIGIVSGVLTKGNKQVGTVIAEKTWPVTLRSGGSSESNARVGVITPAQETCRVLQIALGPVDVNLLGFQVTLGAVSLDIVGEVGTPLGDLVCAISNLLGQVAAVVELLNSLLGLLTGLLGGLVPPV